MKVDRNLALGRLRKRFSTILITLAAALIAMGTHASSSRFDWSPGRAPGFLLPNSFNLLRPTPLLPTGLFGDINVGGPDGQYPTLRDAIIDLNQNGVGPGGVHFLVA